MARITQQSSIGTTGTSFENEPIVKSDGASSDVMEWAASTGSSAIKVTEGADNKLDLTVDGKPVVAGVHSDGAGLHFESGGYIELANSAAAEFGTSDFSVEFVLNQKEANVSSNNIFRYPDGGDNRVFIESIGGTTKITFRDTGNAAYDLGYDMSADYGTPTHYVLTADRDGNALLYKNGNQVGSVDISASSSVNIGSGNTGVGAIGSSSANYTMLGTFYRFRTWNKIVDAKALFERADVPVADQYGSETKLNSSTCVNATSSNAFNTFSGASATGFTAVSTGAGSSSQFAATADEISFVKGKKYSITFDATLNSGTAPKWNAAISILSATATTDHSIATVTAGANGGIFTANQTTTGVISFKSEGGAATNFAISNLKVVRCGAVVDLDLAFANPTQSLTVQDRSGTADGTCSASGVTQVQPVVQLNSTSARIGTTAASPADGAIIADKLGIGIAPSHAATIYGTGAGNATVQIEGEGGADPTINFLTNNTTHWAIGVDDSDSDNFKIVKHSAIGSTNNYLTIDSSGQVNIGTGTAEKLLTLQGDDAQIRLLDTSGTNQFASMSSEGGIAKFTSRNNASHGSFSFQSYNGTAVTERMSISATGKTTATGSTTDSSGLVDTLQIKNGGTQVGDGGKLLFTAGTSTNGAGIGSTGQALNSADLKFYTGGSNERLHIHHSTGLATFSGDTKIGDGLVSNYVKHVAGLDDTVAISFTFPSQSSRYIHQMLELRVAMGDDGAATATPTFLRYAFSTLTTASGITQMDASLGTGITASTSASGTTFTVTLTEGSGVAMDSVTVFATVTSGHANAKCTGMTVA